MQQIKRKDGTAIPPAHCFTIRESKIDKGPKYWPYCLVEIFDGATKIGEYIRHYPSFAASTFYPFDQNGKWFALYSADYTCSRLMSLPDCKDIGGEEPSDGGFCPVEFYVPAYIRQKFEQLHKEEGPIDVFYWDNRADQIISEGADGWSDTLSSWTYTPFSFVSGCVWGDDSSWKLQYIDLAEASKGIVQRKELFGYVKLADALSLRESIDMSSWEPENPQIEYICSRIFNLGTGRHESDLD